MNADSWSTPPEGMRRYLKSCSSQVIFLQEVWTPETFRDCADSLPTLQCYYQEGVSAPELAICTSLPVKRVVTVTGINDVAMALQVDWHDSPLLLCCVHLRKPDSLRLRWSLAAEINRGHVAEIEKLADFAAAAGMPVIVGGDFNSPPASPGQNLLRTSLRDCFYEGGSGFGYTFPAFFPLWRIDSLFVSWPWTCSACRVGPNMGSDHRPFTATLGRSPQATGLER